MHVPRSPLRQSRRAHHSGESIRTGSPAGGSSSPFMNDPVQQPHVQKSCVRPRQIKRPRARHMNRGRRCRRQRAMALHHKLSASCVARLRILKNFFRLHVQNRISSSGSQDSFQVAHAAAAAEFFLWIERHHRVNRPPTLLRSTEIFRSRRRFQLPRRDSICAGHRGSLQFPPLSRPHR